MELIVMAVLASGLGLFFDPFVRPMLKKSDIFTFYE
jgi:hypothetical protein